MQPKTILISGRFCGPPGFANGGYVCGALSRFIGPAAEIRLYRPVPLDQPLTVECHDGSVQLFDGSELLAAAKTTTLDIEVPSPPSYEAAAKATAHYIGFTYHPFESCFVCGPARAEGDGLRLFAGSVPGHDLVASPWTPHVQLADANGFVHPEYLWATLDCPGYFAAFTGKEPRLAVLGSLVGEIFPKVMAREPCVVVGWHVASKGRKHHVGTALFNASGECCGAAHATWIELR